MNSNIKPKIYREVIDSLVDMCHNGQGQISSTNVLRGVWNDNASEEELPDQHKINLLLASMSVSDRELLAKMLLEEVITGVFETLKSLEEHEIEPFKDGYEGSPYNDFIGRVSNNWEWPES
jgi:hypothetical protein